MSEEANTRPLAASLRERIRRGGPITFRDWMESALYDGRGGYYSRRDLARWGRAGDYRTSPETSPLFAATFARYFAALHAELGSPPRFTICEAGAGAGLFARGLLDTLARDHPELFRAARYLLDERGGDSLARAAQNLSEYSDKVEFVRLSGGDAPPRTAGESALPGEVAARGGVASLGESATLGEGVIFSNELVDAFPVHRVVRRGGRLRELFVGADEAGRFVWAEGDPSTPRLAEHFARLGVALAEGQFAEVNLEAEDWLRGVARRLARGFVVTVDYGAESRELYDPRARPEGTLRAFRAHKLCADLLADPGAQDLTSTVNWTQLRRAGEEAGLRTVLLERQDAFLMRAGFLEQLERASARAADEAERASLRLSAREMILPGGMGNSFQVLVQSKAVSD